MVTELHFGSTLPGVGLIIAFASVATALAIGVSVRRGAGRSAIINRVLVVWLVASLAAVAILTLQPGPGGFDGARPTRFNPFARLDREDAVANLLLYVPVGFFTALLLRSKSRNVVWATAFAFAVSFTVEFAQWALPIDRAATTHDVVFNTLGGLVGAVLGTLVAKVVPAPGGRSLGEGK